MNIPPPSSWLSTINVPGMSTNGLSFISGSIVPFVIGILLFLIIILSLIFLIWGGLGWITSSGNKEGLAKAKGTITYALIGLVLGLGSFLIIGIISQLFSVDLGLGIPVSGQDCYAKRSECYSTKNCTSPFMPPSLQIACMNQCDKICKP